jgi:hypothetical protein
VRKDDAPAGASRRRAAAEDDAVGIVVLLADSASPSLRSDHGRHHGSTETQPVSHVASPSVRPITVRKMKRHGVSGSTVMWAGGHQ